MRVQEIFISSILTLLFFNFIYISSTPSKINTMSIGALTGLVLQVVVYVIVSGVKVAGSGLDSATIKIIFAVGVMLNIFFRVEIIGLPIGLGIMNNLFEVFSKGDLLGIGFFMTTVFSFITLASGLIIIISGLSGGE